MVSVGPQPMAYVTMWASMYSKCIKGTRRSILQEAHREGRQSSQRAIEQIICLRDAHAHAAGRRVPQAAHQPQRLATRYTRHAPATCMVHGTQRPRSARWRHTMSDHEHERIHQIMRSTTNPPVLGRGAPRGRGQHAVASHLAAHRRRCHNCAIRVMFDGSTPPPPTWVWRNPGDRRGRGTRGRQGRGRAALLRQACRYYYWQIGRIYRISSLHAARCTWHGV